MPSADAGGPSALAIRALEHVPYPVVVLHGLEIVGASAALEELVGAASGALRGSALGGIFPSLGTSSEIVARVRAAPAPTSTARLTGVVCRRLDGAHITVDVAARALPPDAGGGIVLSVDAPPLTPSRSLSDAILRRDGAQRALRTRLDASVIAAVKDARGAYESATLVPPRSAVTATSFIGRTDAELFSPDLAAAIVDTDAMARSNPGAVVVLEKLDGADPFRVYKAVLDLDGAPRLFILNIDLREERAQLARLAESEARHRALLDASPDLIFLFSPEDEFVDFHLGFESQLYVPPESFLGRRVTDVMPHEVGEGYARTAREARADGRPRSFDYDLDVAGRRRVFEARLVPFTDGRVVCVTRDVTDARRALSLEQELLQAQRLEALGVLAGGIAHDFNNVLAAIVGFAETLRARLGEHPAAALAAEILHAGFRGRDLVAQVLTFARRTETGRRPVALAAVAREAARLLRAGLPGAEVDVRLDERVPTVLAEPSQLHRVVMNLVTNSAQASRGAADPRIEVRAGVRTVRDADPVAAGVPPGEYAVLAVSDHGVGMDAPTRARMFDPFFTTRGPGEGTGLGLSVVHGIVRAHGGHLLVRTAPGVGTTVEVLLPTTDAEPSPAEELAITPSPVPVRSARRPRVLVVEDDASVARSFALVLDTLGFEAVVEQDPRNAAPRARDDDELDLVVTDLSMPRMSGLEVAREVTELRPDLPVLLVTGNASTLHPEDLRAARIVGVLPKPVEIDKLEQVIGRALSAARRRVPRDRA